MPSQYPNNGVQTKLFPTCVLGVVSKFDPATKYKEEEEIPDENGILKYVVGVDNQTEIDVELVLYPNQNIPAPLTNIAFNYNAVNGGGNVSYLIRGDVKNAGSAGKAKRIAFKMMVNSNLP